MRFFLRTFYTATLSGRDYCNIQFPIFCFFHIHCMCLFANIVEETLDKKSKLALLKQSRRTKVKRQNQRDKNHAVVKNKKLAKFCIPTCLFTSLKTRESVSEILVGKHQMKTNEQRFMWFCLLLSTGSFVQKLSDDIFCGCFLSLK